jgi:hypothetical protein
VLPLPAGKVKIALLLFDSKNPPPLKNQFVLAVDETI